MADSYVSGHGPVVARLLDALGLSGEGICKLVLTIVPDDLVRLEVTRYAREGSLDDVTQLVLAEGLRAVSLPAEAVSDG